MARGPYGPSDLKLIYVSDLAKINSKVYLLFKLRAVGVCYDHYRKGLAQDKYESFMKAAEHMSSCKIDISPCDFYRFPLDILIEYTLNRRCQSGESLAYYHCKERELQAFRNYLEKRFYPALNRAMASPALVTSPYAKEFLFEYKQVFKRKLA